MDIQRCTQSISRHLQSGSSSTEDFEELKKKKEDLQNDMEEHRKITRESLQYFHHFIERCNKQWCEIVALESSSSSPERDQKLQQLQNTFTLLLSADYQMSKLLPYWGHSPQPSSTSYLQKVSYDIYGIVDHIDRSGYLYLMNETAGPKNTDLTISYLMHYVKSSGKVPSWVRVHVFMDNASSTNKNQYMMAAALEIVQLGIMDYLRISFMIAGTQSLPQTNFFP